MRDNPDKPWQWDALSRNEMVYQKNFTMEAITDKQGKGKGRWSKTIKLANQIGNEEELAQKKE